MGHVAWVPISGTTNRRIRLVRMVHKTQYALLDVLIQLWLPHERHLPCTMAANMLGGCGERQCPACHANAPEGETVVDGGIDTKESKEDIDVGVERPEDGKGPRCLALAVPAWLGTCRMDTVGWLPLQS